MRVIKYDLTGACSSQTQLQDVKRYGDIAPGDTSAASVMHVSTVIESGGVSYTAQEFPKYGLSLTDSGTWHMLTCFVVKDKSITPRVLQALRDDFVRVDDVFCDSFLETILLVANDDSVSDVAIQLLKSWGCSTVYQLPFNYEIAPGPYFYSVSGIFWAWRLFPDEQEAFVLSTIPSQKDRNVYQTLNAAASGASSLSIAVPSRLYFAKSEKFPFAGLRVSVKDLYHLKGVHTGAGNRAYRRLYPARTSTSPALQKIIDSGAIIVGKAKTAEFAGSQEVIGDWCDYSYALNIRSDGYLVSTGSSTGSASGLAAYPWLDFSLGSDAGGSIRDPSVAHGIYGFRPTHDGSATRDAVVPCPIFQVPGFMGKSSAGMLDFGLGWLTAQPISNLLECGQLWFPPEYYSDRDDVQSVAEDVVSKLAAWLDVKISRQSLEEAWESGKPYSAQGSFAAFFGKTFMDILTNEYWEHAASFRRDYQQKFKAAPYVCKTTQWLWSEGSSTTPARKADALKEVATHNEWLFSSMLDVPNTLMVFPMYNLDYRDEYLRPPKQRSYYGFDSNLHASLAGLPNVIVPVGQCSFHSSITKRNEMFPVSLSIVGPKGADIALLRLVHKFLEASNMPTSVLTGATAFSLG